jgi:hypothetical protein
MEYLEAREFGRRTVDGRPCGHYDISLYYGQKFPCACGQEHDLRPWMEIVSELPLFRFIVACPDGQHLTVVKARWDRDAESRYLESEFGTALTEKRPERIGIEFQAGLLEAKTGRRWSLEETEAYIQDLVLLAQSRKGL